MPKNNPVYSLLKDTFQVSGSSRCEALSVTDLKEDKHSLMLYQRMPVGLNISPAKWQSYTNAILDSLQIENIVKQQWMIFYPVDPK